MPAVVVPPLAPLIGSADEIYLSFAECPHDVLPPGYQDGDDSKHATRGTVNAFEEARDALSLDEPFTIAALEPFWMKQPRRVIVPLGRTIKLRMGGGDVLAVQRAMAAARYRKWGTFTHSFGAGLLAEVKRFQHEHNLRADGIYGEETHRALTPFFDSYGISLMTQYAAHTAIQRAQKRALSAAMIAYNYRWQNHYTQSALRWMMIAHHIRQESLPSWNATYSDCSSWFEWVYWDGGLPDPSELDYTGGFTGTIGVHGTRVEPSQAPIGAGFLYGYEPWEHIQMSVGGEDTIGDGGEAGPLYLPAYYRRDLNVVKRFPGMS